TRTIIFIPIGPLALLSGPDALAESEVILPSLTIPSGPSPTSWSEAALLFHVIHATRWSLGEYSSSTVHIPGTPSLRSIVARARMRQGATRRRAATTIHRELETASCTRLPARNRRNSRFVIALLLYRDPGRPA